MLKYLISTILLFSFIISNLHSKEYIGSARLSFELPAENWYMSGKSMNNGNSIYFYERNNLFDSNNFERYCKIEFYITIPENDQDSSSAISLNLPEEFNVAEVRGPGAQVLGIDEAMIFKGSFFSGFGQVKGYVIHAKHNGKLIEITLFSHDEVFEQVDEEFQSIINSMEFPDNKKAAPRE